MAVFGTRFVPQLFIVLIFIGSLNFYYIYNLHAKNNELKVAINYYENAMLLAGRKYTALEKSSQKAISSKHARIKDLDQQVKAKHKELGNLQAALAGLKKRCDEEKQGYSRTTKNGGMSFTVCYFVRNNDYLQELRSIRPRHSRFAHTMRSIRPHFLVDSPTTIPQL